MFGSCTTQWRYSYHDALNLPSVTKHCSMFRWFVFMIKAVFFYTSSAKYDSYCVKAFVKFLRLWLCWEIHSYNMCILVFALQKQSTNKQKQACVKGQDDGAKCKTLNLPDLTNSGSDWVAHVHTCRCTPLVMHVKRMASGFLTTLKFSAIRPAVLEIRKSGTHVCTCKSPTIDFEKST